ncbi:MAG: hypothetical protein RIC55_00160 [Pirellulaceae bacterium]
MKLQLSNDLAESLLQKEAQDHDDKYESTYESLTAARAGAYAQALQTYADAVTAANGDPELIDAAWLAKAETQQDINNQYYGVDLPGAEKLRKNQDAASIYKRDTTKSAALKHYQEQKAAHDRWRNDHLANAKLDRDVDIADATEQRDNDIAQAALTLSNTIAVAEETYSNRVAELAASLDQALAQAKLDAIETWSQQEGSAWSAYQKELAQNEVNHINAVNTKFLVHQQAVNAATRNETEQVALATKQWADELAEALWTRTVDEAIEVSWLELEASAAQQTRTNTLAEKVETQSDAISLAEKTFAEALAQIQYDRLFNEHSEEYPDDLYTLQQQLALVHHNAIDARGEAIADATRAYRIDYHAAEQVWHDAIADQYVDHDAGMADAERDYSVSLTAATSTLSVRSAEEYEAWWTTVAPLDKTYDDDLALLSKQFAVDNATSDKTFQTNVADAYASAVESWNTSTSTPWSAYLSALAEAEAERVGLTGDAFITYATSLGDANITYTGLVTTADKTYNQADAAAYKTQAVAMATALNDYATTVGQARVDHATQVAQETAEHDKAVVGLNKGYRDAIAFEQETWTDNVRQAEWDYQAAESQAELDYSEELITEAEKFDLVADADEARQDAIEAAEILYATNLRPIRLQWMYDRADEMVELTSDVGIQREALAAVVRTETIDLADDRNAASKQLNSTIEEEVRKLTVAYAEARYGTGAGGTAGLIVSVAAADRALDEDLEGAQNGHTIDVNTALDAYQSDMLADHGGDLDAAATATGFDWVEYNAAAATAEQTQNTTMTSITSGHDAAVASKHATFRDTMDDADAGLVQAQVDAQRSLAVGQAAAAKVRNVAEYDALADQIAAFQTVAANRAEDELQAEVAYQNGHALARETRSDAEALASSVWVTDRLTALTTYYASQAPDRDAVRDAAYAAADELRGDKNYDAKIIFVGTVGNELYFRAEDLGDAIITWATDMGDARIGYTTAVNTAEAGYATAVTGVTNTYAHDSTAADSSFTAALAAAQKTLSTGLANLAAQFQHDIVQPLADYAEDIAGAQVGYFTGLASAAASTISTWAAAELTDEAQFLAAQASAASTWISTVAANFSGNAASYASADANFSASQQDASAGRTQTTADAEVAYTNGVETLAAARVTNSVARRRTFEEGAVARDNTRAEDGTLADKNRSVKYAEDAKAYAMAMALAERNYQVAEAEAVPGSTHELDRDKAHAQASLDRVTRQADADLDWIVAQVGANKTLVKGHAGAVAQLEADLADYDKTFADGVTAKSATLQAAYDGAHSAFASLVDAASSALHITYAGLSAAVLGDQYAADEAATTVINTSQGSPWSLSLKNISITVKSWWEGNESDFQAQAANEAAAGTIRQNATNLAADTRSGSTITAQSSASNSRTTAQRDLRAGVAAAHAEYIDDLADPTETYIVDVALADRNFKVDEATAARDKVFGEVAGVPYGQSEYDAALETAADERDATTTAAYITYAIGQANAGGARRTALNVVEDAYTNLVTGAQVAFTAAMNAANTLYTSAVSAAETAHETTTSQSNTSYVAASSGALATAVSDLAVSVATPWVNFAASVLGAQSEVAEDQAEAKEAHTVAVATADETHAVAMSQHEATHQTSTTAAGSTYQQALTEYLGDLRDAFTGVVSALAAAAAHFPVPPKVPTPPELVGDYTVEALPVDEYFRTFSADLEGTGWALGAPMPVEDLDQHEGSALDGNHILDGIERQVEGLTQVETTDEQVQEQALAEFGESLWSTAGSLSEAFEQAFAGLFAEGDSDEFAHYKDDPNVIVHNGHAANIDDFQLGLVPIEYMLAADGDVLDPSHPSAATAASILNAQRSASQNSEALAQRNGTVGAIGQNSIVPSRPLPEPPPLISKEEYVQAVLDYARREFTREFLGGRAGPITPEQSKSIETRIEIVKGLAEKLYAEVVKEHQRASQNAVIRHLLQDPAFQVAKRIAKSPPVTQIQDPLGTVYHLNDAFFEDRAAEYYQRKSRINQDLGASCGHSQEHVMDALKAGIPTQVCHGVASNTGLLVGPTNSHRVLGGAGHLQWFVEWRMTGATGAVLAGMVIATPAVVVSGPAISAGAASLGTFLAAEGSLLTGSVAVAAESSAPYLVAAATLLATNPQLLEQGAVASEQYFNKFTAEDWIRLEGIMRMAGGTTEAAGAALSPEAGPVAMLVYAHGVDELKTGWYMWFSGQRHRTATSQGISGTLVFVGTDEATAAQLGELGDAGIGIFLQPGAINRLSSADFVPSRPSSRVVAVGGRPYRYSEWADDVARIRTQTDSTIGFTPDVWHNSIGPDDFRGQLITTPTEPVFFGQRRVAPRFRLYSGAPPQIAGRSLDAVAADLASGKVLADDLIVQITRHPDGRLVALSNRSWATLQMAGRRPSNVLLVPFDELTPDELLRLIEDPLPGHGASVISNRLPVTLDEAGTQHVYSVFFYFP